MKRQRWWLPLVALVLAVNWKPSLTLPVPDEKLDTSAKLLGSSVITSVSIVTGAPSTVADEISAKPSTADRKRVIPSMDLPASPADLMRPDKFQFFTLNKDGNVVTKQMTEKEIQTLIAAGGGHLPMEIHEPQKVGDIPNGGMKVADVVQNVQNVLKSELNKPATVMTSMPTIPGHVNTEWSSILPAILGGESETGPVNEPVSPMVSVTKETPTVVDTAPISSTESTGASITNVPDRKPESSSTIDYDAKRPTGILETDIHTEKPMIQVPVITVDQKLSTHQPDEDSTPVFQMLNTISADKMKTKNETNTNENSKPNGIQDSKVTISEPEKKVPEQPNVVTKPIVTETQAINDKVPEMIEINYNSVSSKPSVISHVKKPINKPASDNQLVITSESSSKLPISEPPAMMTVVSETHSTSIKVSGQEEVPLRQPPGLIIEPANNVQISTQKLESVTEKSTVSTTVPKIDVTIKSKVSTAKPIETSTEQSAPSSSFFFENLPQTVSSIVSNLISGTPSSSTPIIEEADTNDDLSTVKEPSTTIEPTSIPAAIKSTVTTESTLDPNAKSGTTKKPAESQKPVYQMMPAIVPDNVQEVSPEVSAIEHIIGTLNDPTSSLSGAVATDHFDKKTSQNMQNMSSIIPSSKVPESPSSSTSATPSNLETSVDSDKPVEPLPTELADSLTSMISQISDAMPSVLPLGENAGKDTTEKKNTVNLTAEDAMIEDSKTTEAEVSEKVVEENNLTQSNSEKTAVAPQNQTQIPQKLSTNDNEETTEKLKETSSTELPIITQSLNLQSATTIQIALMNDSINVPVNRIDITHKPESLSEDSENTKSQSAAVESSVATTVNELPSQPSTLQSIITESSTESVTPIEVYSEKTSTPEAITNNLTNALLDLIDSESKIQTEDAASIFTTLNDSKIEAAKIENDENMELSIVRLDIKGTKPPKFHKNESQDKESTSGEESPLVRIQLTDPVTMANNIIESTNIDADPPQVSLAPVTLPESGSVGPNTIASGLIAGYPSTTTSPTILTNDSIQEISTIEPVKYSPEVLLLNDAPANNFTDVITKLIENNDVHKNIQKPETQELDKQNTENIEHLKTTIAHISSTELPLEKVSINKTPVAENKEKSEGIQSPEATTAMMNELSPEISTNQNVDASTTLASPASSETPNDSVQPTGGLSTSDKTIASSDLSKKVPENRIDISPPQVSDQIILGDKVNEFIKLKEAAGEVSANTKTEQPQPTETTIKHSNNSTEPSNQLHTDNLQTSTPASEKISIAPLKNEVTETPVVEAPTTKRTTVSDAESQTVELIQDDSTTKNPIESSQSPNDSSSSLPSKVSNRGEEQVINENKEQEKITENIEVPVSTEKTPLNKKNETSTSSTMQQTQEIRVQVNETAVRVTKRPISESSSQKLNEITKSPENQHIKEQTTTPRIPSIAADLYTKLGEKVELPVPTKLNDSSPKEKLSSSNESTEDIVPNIETRINLGDEQSPKIEKDKVPAKIDDTRKPIKKNNDDASEDKVLVSAAPIKISTDSDEKVPGPQNNSSTDLSTKTELPLSPSPEKPSNLSNPELGTIQEKLSPEKLSQLPNKNSTHKVVENSIPRPLKPVHKPTLNIKKDDSPTKPADDQWTLIPQQIHPASKTSGNHKRPVSTETPLKIVQDQEKVVSNDKPVVPLDHPQSASGLDSTVKNLETDIAYFSNLCNELAFTFWTATNKGLSTARSLAVSPFGMTSMLAMIFLGARGPTSDQMNDILKLDDVASFNPHLVFQNVTDAVGLARNQGIANAAFVRELFADRLKVRKLMPFYKERAQQFYDGVVAEVNFATISDLVRRRTNLMIRKQTGGRIKDFVRTNTVPLRSPLAALSANVFQTDCNSSAASSEGRDGELYFAVSPAVRQRKLVPVPATVWRAGVLAGYEPGLDATVIALGGIDKLVSTIFALPGQQGVTAPGDTLDRLEQRLVKGAIHDGSWNKLLKVLVPRPGLELQVPKFSHRSVINATAALKRMGLEEIFSKHADLKGINGVATDLHLADVLQMNLFSTCGDENIISGRHHVEVYPGSPLRNARDYGFEENSDEREGDYLSNEEDELRDLTEAHVPRRETRSARQNDSEKQRLKLDRPFLYFVRHNPTGMILHMGRFNPRLLP